MIGDEEYASQTPLSIHLSSPHNTPTDHPPNQLNNRPPPRRRRPRHRPPRRPTELPNLRQQDRARRDRIRIQQVHEREERYRDRAH